MRTITLNIILFVLLSIASASSWSNEYYPLRVETMRNGHEHIVMAYNSGPAPVSLKVTLSEIQNVGSDREWPIYVVVRPYSNLPLARLFSANRSSGYRFRLNTSYLLGDFSALHDPRAVYSLPYEDGKTYYIVQAPDGPLTTHNTPHSRYAIDIAMPEGTPILAARAGVVISAVGSNVYGGKESALLSKANQVRILHDDATIASYAHLTPNGITVQVGQQVSEGHLIGYSGSTGYSSGPHLHFAVTQTIRTNEGFTEVSVPVNFYVGDPPISFQPQTGTMLTAEYSRPVRFPGVIPNPDIPVVTTVRSVERHFPPLPASTEITMPQPSPLKERLSWLDLKLKGTPIWIWLVGFLIIWWTAFKAIHLILYRKRQQEIEEIRRLFKD